MQIKQLRHMGFLLMLLSGLFLWNPVFGFSDSLPSVFGYLLMWLSLSLLADLNESIAEARRRFGYLIWVGAGELLIGYLLGDTAAEQTSAYQQPTWVLLFSFVLLILQWWLLIPAFRNLLAGIGRLADKHPCEWLSAMRRNRTPSERLSRISTVFVLGHSISAFLPELAILTSFEYQANNEKFGFDWYDYIDMFRTVGVVVSLVFGLIWLIAWLRYTARILRDREWIEQLRSAYVEEILPQEEMLRGRRLRTAFVLLSIGILFAASIRIDGQVALSGAVLAALLGCTVGVLGDLLPNRDGYRGAWISLLVVGVANALTKYLYLQRFEVESSKYQTDAFWFFTATQLLEILEAAFVLLAVWKAIGLLLSLANHHAVVDYRTPGSEEISKRATARLQRSFRIRAGIAGAVFSLAAVGYMLDAILQLSVNWLWMLPFAASLVGIFLFLAFLHELFTQIRWRYLSDAAYKGD